MTFSITTLSIIGLSATLSINDTQLKMTLSLVVSSAIMLSVIMLSVVMLNVVALGN